MENTEMAESQNPDLIAEENNFIEILADDDNIEYVGYEEDDVGYVVLEQDYDEEMSRDQNADFDTVSINEEEPVSEDLYHCNTCNIYINSIDEHINEFHKDESVFLEGEEHIENDQIDGNLVSVKGESQDDQEFAAMSDRSIKTENENGEYGETIYSMEGFIDDETVKMTHVEYINEITDSAGASGSNDEMFFDSVGRPYIRKIDDINFEPRKLERKRNAKSATISEYTEIGEAYSDKGDLLQDAEPNTLFVCPKCSTKFVSERKLGSHKCSNNKSSVKTKSKKIPNEQVVCEICNTTFASNKCYRLHARMHAPVKTRPIEEAVSYELKASAKDGKLSNETFFCEICNKSYDITFQDVHEKSHKNVPTFTCTICNKKFTDEINYAMHIKAHQDNPKTRPPTKAERNGTTLPYECTYCGRQFSRPHEKVKHERIHTGEKPYKCEICGKCFRVAYCLTLHLRTHTAARPYVCPHCNKRFKAHSGYSHHLMIHSDERAYKCPHCPKAFKTAVQLAGHKNSHTKPFSCPECNRPFASLYAVKAHMETHVRSSHTLKHRCPICGAIYARVFALKDHMKEQHQTNFTEGDDVTADMNIAEVPFLNETETSTQSILPEDVKAVSAMISIDDMDHFQAEEVVTDWLK